MSENGNNEMNEDRSKTDQSHLKVNGLANPGSETTSTQDNILKNEEGSESFQKKWGSCILTHSLIAVLFGVGGYWFGLQHQQGPISLETSISKISQQNSVSSLPAVNTVSSDELKILRPMFRGSESIESETDWSTILETTYRCAEITPLSQKSVEAYLRDKTLREFKNDFRPNQTLFFSNVPQSGGNCLKGISPDRFHRSLIFLDKVLTARRKNNYLKNLTVGEISTDGLWSQKIGDGRLATVEPMFFFPKDIENAIISLKVLQAVQQTFLSESVQFNTTDFQGIHRNDLQKLTDKIREWSKEEEISPDEKQFWTEVIRWLETL